MSPRLFAVVSLSLVLVLGSVTADAARRHHHPAPPPKPHNDAAALVVTTIEAVATTQKGALRSAWVQYGPGGTVEARAVVDGKDCPSIFVDLHEQVMHVRTTSDRNFATVCAMPLPKGTKQAAIVYRVFRVPPPVAGSSAEVWETWAKDETGLSAPGPGASMADWLSWSDAVVAKTNYRIVPLTLPVADPQRILVLGDTGCRIKGKTLQDCNDPDKWPFPQIAARAARLKPDLVIDVGDYLYRENACPPDFAGCSGTPFGDNWPTWDADFFAPAKPLLAAAPWVFVRGNHEDCNRSGLGWLRLLGPQPYDAGMPCIGHLAPYSVPLAAMNLVVMDDTDAADTSDNGVLTSQEAVYRNEIASLASAKAPAWLLLHRPIWAAITGPLGLPVGGNKTLIAAIGRAGIPSPIELMLAGHIHSFEAINYAPSNHVPPQVVAGFGGDKLDATPANLQGTVFQGDSGVRVADGLSVGGFGFLLMTKTDKGWTIDVHDVHGRIERKCLFQGGRVDCPKKH